mmetsp:Transcript_94268/g.186885  ORF Transcript_94268/g.186885 Transcript_94268/m.186885 type:complete len:92 (+) Transcript_94268:575-850(+)
MSGAAGIRNKAPSHASCQAVRVNWGYQLVSERLSRQESTKKMAECVSERLSPQESTKKPAACVLYAAKPTCRCCRTRAAHAPRAWLAGAVG